MSETTTLLPYVRTCGFCDNGLLRLWRSSAADRIVALCDECELYWDDVAAVYEDADTPSSGAFPVLEGEWRAATREEVEASQLGSYVRGESE